VFDDVGVAGSHYGDRPGPGSESSDRHLQQDQFELGCATRIEDDYFTGLRGYAMSQHHGAGKNFWDCFMLSQAESYVCSHNPQAPTGSSLLNAYCTVTGDGVSRCSVFTDVSPALVAWFHWDDSNPNILYYELPGVNGFSDAQELGRCDLQAQSCWFYQ
jgi:hypothetical protein